MMRPFISSLGSATDATVTSAFTSLAIRWMLEAARRKKGRPIHMRLADELADAYRRQGTAYERRENTHKMAEANRAFAHFGRRR